MGHGGRRQLAQPATQHALEVARIVGGEHGGLAGQVVVPSREIQKRRAPARSMAGSNWRSAAVNGRTAW